MTKVADYTYSIKCDTCGQHVCWCRWGGPFNGSIVCNNCYDCEINRATSTEVSNEQ